MKKILMNLALMAAVITLSSVSLRAQTAVEEDPDLQYGTELLKPGTKAPDFKLNDINGKSVRLKNFRKKNVVLVFWATWCPDCRAEVPLLKEMYAKSDPKKTVFVYVSFDRSFDQLCQYVKENDLPGVQLFDPAGKKESKVGADYHVKWIPSLYLIGPDGRIKCSTVVAEKVAKAI